MLDVTLFVQSQHASFESHIDGPGVSIGRRPDAASVVIDDDGLSKRHCSVYRNETTVWVVDDGSTNGSFVNSRPIPAGGTILGDGDEISIGHHTTITVNIRQVAATAQPLYAAPAPQQPAASAAAQWWATPQAAIAAVLVVLIIAATVVVIAATKLTGPRTPASANSRPTRKPSDRDPFESLPVSTSLADDIEITEPPAKIDSTTSVDVREALTAERQDRGGPMGNEAKVDVPPELQHYPDKRRFLAVQAAKAREAGLEIPHDFAALASLITSKQLVELKPAGENYVLDGPGEGVKGDPFNHFDVESGRSVPIFRTAAEMQAGLASMSEEERSFVTSYYKTNQALLAAEYNTLSQLAKDFDGKTYDLADPGARQQFKHRMLCFVRPAARDVMQGLAQVYKAKFNRPLALASLVRTEQYQIELSERNANAARNALPPHTTGCAFDISYRYMTAPEQTFLMGEIARLKQQGKVECLRENNNCLHVFAFPDGRPPSEASLRKILG